jgi:hypothetical protein
MAAVWTTSPATAGAAPDRHRSERPGSATDQRLRESGVRSVDELQRLPYNVVSFSEDMRRRNRELKDFLFNNLYRHYRVMRMAVKAEQISARCSGLLLRTEHPAQAYSGLIQSAALERTVCGLHRRHDRSFCHRGTHRNCLTRQNCLSPKRGAQPRVNSSFEDGD